MRRRYAPEELDAKRASELTVIELPHVGHVVVTNLWEIKIEFGDDAFLQWRRRRR